MTRSRDPHDSLLQFDLAAAAYEDAGFAEAAPSLVPSALSNSSAHDAAGLEDLDEVYPSSRGKPMRLYAGVGVALIASVLLVGNHFVAVGRAEERRLAEIARVQQNMAELESKRRAEEASREQVALPTQPTSSVAAMLAASTQSHGSARIPQAQQPNGLNAARQAAAIRRAMQGPVAARRNTAAGTRKHVAKSDDGRHENQARDPIYGL